ncbi:ABC transporter permease [Pyramidobacter sp.]|uniref:ABC transporter permease n=1 Tax=Pyramidobacter sp. TaxID=1943581 RepID=UPI0025F55ECD|nr:ABC transporter permease [Pyramidobacter sp.]MCI7403414.1 ABC transporter permease [Pyramidobacter sp.]MDY3211585.1 ABC transporter permease [Pyramidobacter sp.]
MSRRIFAKRCVLPALLFALWWWGSARQWWSSYVLPSPAQVWRAFWSMTCSGALLGDLWASVRRVAVGFSISFALAFALGLASIWTRRTEYYGHLVEFLRHVPPLSLIPLLILWFGIGEKSKTVLIVLATFFPIYMSVHKGFVTANRKLMEVGRTMGFSKWRLFSRIMFPCAVPDILVGMRIGIGYSWRAIISAEMIAAASGLGYMILDAQQMSRSDKVVAGVFVIGLVGYLTDAALAALIARVAPGAGGDGVG